MPSQNSESGGWCVAGSRSKVRGEDGEMPVDSVDEKTDEKREFHNQEERAGTKP